MPAWGGPEEQKAFSGQTGGVLLVVLLLLTLSFQNILVSADDPPGGPEPSPNPAHLIGNYTHQQEQHNLTTHHAQTLPMGLRVWANPQADEILVDPDFLEEALGAWSTSTSFNVQEDGSIQINQSTALFNPLELGPRSVFTHGSAATIQFSDRPMWVNLTQQNETLHLGLDDGDPTGQEVYVAKELLHDYGIHRPKAFHEDGSILDVTPSDDHEGFWIDIPHFSEITLESDDIEVKGRQAGITVDHAGEITWNTTTNDLYIEVGNRLTTYELLVEKDWFEAHMPHLALKDHSWDLEQVEGKWYHVVTLPEDETPTTINFREYRISEDLLYTYGHPDLLLAHAFNETLREERGPMWIQVFPSDDWVDIQISVDTLDEYEILAAESWAGSLFNETPLFTQDGSPLPVQPALNEGWVFSILENLNLRLLDSETGPLVPPRYERVENGTIKHMDGCAIRHLVHVQESSIVHEGPGCLNATVMKDMANASVETHWLHEAAPVTACAVYFEEMENNETAFVAAPCLESVDALGVLPGFVQDLCTGSTWGSKSDEALCFEAGNPGGITRYHAAGLLLNVTQQDGAVLSEVLFFNDHLMDWENMIRANLTLYEEEGWRGASWLFLHEIRWLQACHDERPLLFAVPVMPETVCGRAINEYEGENGTVVLDLDELRQEWGLLYDDDPCQALETVVVLNGAMDPYCGQALPLVRDAADGLAGEVDWQSCQDQRGFLGLGLGLNRTGGSVCGTVLPEPTGSAGDAWVNVRSLPACVDEMSFELYPSGAIPARLCGEDLEVNEQADVEEVFRYVVREDPCGTDVSLLIVGGDFDSPVVVCTEVVGDLGGSWDEDWAQVAGSNPCGGEVTVMVSNHSVGRSCGYDFSVNTTVWQRVYDAVADTYCLGGGESAFLGIAWDDPLVFCGADLPDNAQTADYWDEVRGAWNPCGTQVLWVPANDTSQLGPVDVCGAGVPDLGGLIGDFRDWESPEGACGGRVKMAVAYGFGESEVCGSGSGDGAQVESLLDSLESGSPCGVGESFVLGFGSVPFAVCGEIFVDLREIFTDLTQVLSDLRPCSLEGLGGSEFCGLFLPDHEAHCDNETLLLNGCSVHSYNETTANVPTGYPVVEGDSVLWFLGGAEFGYDGGCGSSCEVLVPERLRGVMSVMGGSDLQGEVWSAEQDSLGVEANRSAFLPPWGMSVGNLLLSEEVAEPGPPVGFEWFTEEIADRLDAGEEVPIEEIEGFPVDWTDDPLEEAPLPYMKIRPGAKIRSTTGTFLSLGCTANFVFEHAEKERIAIGSAGHCLTELNQTIWTLITQERPDPEADVLKSVMFGEVIMTTHPDDDMGGLGQDFGLIEVNTEYYDLVEPGIAVIDGPCGWRNTTATREDNISDWEPMMYYGHAHIGGNGGTPRLAIAHTNAGAHIEYYRLPGGAGGDSGSPVRFNAIGENLLEASAVHTNGIAADDWPLDDSGGPLEPHPWGQGSSMSRVFELMDENDPDVVAWSDTGDVGKWDLVDSPTCL